MKAKLIISGFALLGLLYACGGGETKEKKESSAASSEAPAAAADPLISERGIGKFTKVDISPQLDVKMAEAGKKVYEVKCASCHKLTDERLVGPGWKGVTIRNTPEWIMNFVTNTDEMLDKDPKAIAQLEICLVRMPNQNLTDDDARSVYEFMRKVDGVK